MIARHQLQGRHLQRPGQAAQVVCAIGRAARQIGVAGVEQDHAAAAQKAVQLQIGLGRGDRLVGTDGPVQKGHQRQIGGFQVDGDGGRRLDRGARDEGLGQPVQPGARDLVQFRIAGQHIAHGEFRGRARQFRVDLLRAGGGAGQAQQQPRDQRGGQLPAPQRKAAQQIGQQRRRSRQQQPARKRNAGGSVGLDHRTGPVGHSHRRARIQRQNPLARGIDAGGQIGRGATGQHLGGDGDRRLGGGQAALPVQHLRRGPDPARRQLLRGGGRAPGPGDQPLQHLNEQARDRQRGPIRIGRGMEQHHPPFAQGPAGHQGRAIGQHGDAARGQIGRGFGHQLAANRHLGRNGQAREGAIGGEGRNRTRRTPAERAAHIAPARPQPHRQQGFIGQLRIGGHARPGKADQQATLGHPIGQRAIGLQPRLVHQHDHVGLGGQGIVQPRLDHAGRALQRAAQEMRGRQQGLPLGPGLRLTDQRHHRTAQPVVAQHDSGGGFNALDLKTRDPAQQFRR